MGEEIQGGIVMVNINLEDMKDVQVKLTTGDNVVKIKLISRSDMEVNIKTTKWNAEYLQEQLEAVVVDEQYRYESMKAELDKAHKRIEELEDRLSNSVRFCRAI